ncbi:vitellogenin-1-like [Chenopodium quinoa]|uniref:vitellogenin-1-like n=1 Tax=Chenopodium quinoa TaxID=63459 RepID=UPI000B784E66|nr:vitellogenin-1-like [Chenopodium quinoa]
MCSRRRRNSSRSGRSKSSKRRSSISRSSSRSTSIRSNSSSRSGNSRSRSIRRRSSSSRSSSSSSRSSSSRSSSRRSSSRSNSSSRSGNSRSRSSSSRSNSSKRSSSSKSSSSRSSSSRSSSRSSSSSRSRFGGRFLVQMLPDYVKGHCPTVVSQFASRIKRVSTLHEALMEAEAYIQAMELCAVKIPSEYKKADKRQSRPTQPAKKEERKRKEVWAAEPACQPSQKKGRRSDPYIPKYEFTKDCTSLLKEVRDRLKLEKPAAMKSPVSSRDKSKYCHFHEDVGHDTEGCFSLRRLFDCLADEGH